MGNWGSFGYLRADNGLICQLDPSIIGPGPRAHLPSINQAANFIYLLKE